MVREQRPRKGTDVGKTKNGKNKVHIMEMGTA